MPKKTQVVIAGGAGVTPTSIVATIGANQVIIRELVDVPGKLIVTFSEDAFVTSHDEVYAAGAPIQLRGHADEGIICRPPNYSASGVPATGEVYCKIKRQDEVATTIMLEELERGRTAV